EMRKQFDIIRGPEAKIGAIIMAYQALLDNRSGAEEQHRTGAETQETVLTCLGLVSSTIFLTKLTMETLADIDKMDAAGLRSTAILVAAIASGKLGALRKLALEAYALRGVAEAAVNAGKMERAVQSFVRTAKDPFAAVHMATTSYLVVHGFVAAGQAFGEAATSGGWASKKITEGMVSIAYQIPIIAMGAPMYGARARSEGDASVLGEYYGEQMAKKAGRPGVEMPKGARAEEAIRPEKLVVPEEAHAREATVKPEEQLTAPPSMTEWMRAKAREASLKKRMITVKPEIQPAAKAGAEGRMPKAEAVAPEVAEAPRRAAEMKTLEGQGGQVKQATGFITKRFEKIGLVLDKDASAQVETLVRETMEPESKITTTEFWNRINKVVVAGRPSRAFSSIRDIKGSEVPIYQSREYLEAMVDIAQEVYTIIPEAKALGGIEGRPKIEMAAVALDIVEQGTFNGSSEWNGAKGTATRVLGDLNMNEYLSFLADSATRNVNAKLRSKGVEAEVFSAAFGQSTDEGGLLIIARTPEAREAAAKMIAAEVKGFNESGDILHKIMKEKYQAMEPYVREVLEGNRLRAGVSYKTIGLKEAKEAPAAEILKNLFKEADNDPKIIKTEGDIGAFGPKEARSKIGIDIVSGADGKRLEEYRLEAQKGPEKKRAERQNRVVEEFGTMENGKDVQSGAQQHDEVLFVGGEIAFKKGPEGDAAFEKYHEVARDEGKAEGLMIKRVVALQVANFGSHEGGDQLAFAHYDAVFNARESYAKAHGIPPESIEVIQTGNGPQFVVIIKGAKDLGHNAVLHNEEGTGFLDFYQKRQNGYTEKDGTAVAGTLTGPFEGKARGMRLGPESITRTALEDGMNYLKNGFEWGIAAHADHKAPVLEINYKEQVAGGVPTDKAYQKDASLQKYSRLAEKTGAIVAKFISSENVRAADNEWMPAALAKAIERASKAPIDGSKEMARFVDYVEKEGIRLRSFTDVVNVAEKGGFPAIRDAVKDIGFMGNVDRRYKDISADDAADAISKFKERRGRIPAETPAAAEAGPRLRVIPGGKEAAVEAVKPAEIGVEEKRASYVKAGIEGYELRPEEARKAEVEREGVRTALESRRSGAAAALAEHYGITHLERYHPETLATLYDNIGKKTDKPVALVMVAGYDASPEGMAAFSQAQLRDSITALEKDFDVRIVEVESGIDAAKRIVDAKRHYGKPSVLLLAAHGTVDRMRLGSGEGGVASMEDVLKVGNFARYFTEKATVVLISCSTGAKEGLADRVQAKFGNAHVYAPSEDTWLRELRFTGNRDGSPTFHVEYMEQGIAAEYGPVKAPEPMPVRDTTFTVSRTWRVLREPGHAERDTTVTQFTLMNGPEQEKVISALRLNAAEERARGGKLVNAGMRTEGHAAWDRADHSYEQAIYLQELSALAGETGKGLEAQIGIPPGELSRLYSNAPDRMQARQAVADRLGMERVDYSDDHIFGILLTGNLPGVLAERLPGAKPSDMKNVGGGATGAYEVKASSDAGKYTGFPKKVDMHADKSGSENFTRSGVPAPETITTTKDGKPLTYRDPDGKVSPYGISRSIAEFDGDVDILGQKMRLRARNAVSLYEMDKSPEAMDIFINQKDRFDEQMGYTFAASFATGAIDGHEANTFPMLMEVVNSTPENLAILRKAGYEIMDAPDGKKTVFMIGRIDTDDGGGTYLVTGQKGSFDFSQHHQRMGKDEIFPRIFTQLAYLRNQHEIAGCGPYRFEIPEAQVNAYRQLKWQVAESSGKYYVETYHQEYADALSKQASEAERLNVPGPKMVAKPSRQPKLVTPLDMLQEAFGTGGKEGPFLRGVKRWAVEHVDDPLYRRDMIDGFRRNEGQPVGISSFHVGEKGDRRDQLSRDGVTYHPGIASNGEENMLVSHGDGRGPLMADYERVSWIYGPNSKAPWPKEVLDLFPHGRAAYVVPTERGIPGMMGGFSMGGRNFAVFAPEALPKELAGKAAGVMRLHEMLRAKPGFGEMTGIPVQRKGAIPVFTDIMDLGPDGFVREFSKMGALTEAEFRKRQGESAAAPGLIAPEAAAQKPKGGTKPGMEKPKPAAPREEYVRAGLGEMPKAKVESEVFTFPTFYKELQDAITGAKGDIQEARKNAAAKYGITAVPSEEELNWLRRELTGEFKGADNDALFMAYVRFKRERQIRNFADFDKGTTINAGPAQYNPENIAAKQTLRDAMKLVKAEKDKQKMAAEQKAAAPAPAPAKTEKTEPLQERFKRDNVDELIRNNDPAEARSVLELAYSPGDIDKAMHDYSKQSAEYFADNILAKNKDGGLVAELSRGGYDAAKQYLKARGYHEEAILGILSTEKYMDLVGQYNRELAKAQSPKKEDAPVARAMTEKTLQKVRSYIPPETNREHGRMVILNEESLENLASLTEQQGKKIVAKLLEVADAMARLREGEGSFQDIIKSVGNIHVKKGGQYAIEFAHTSRVIFYPKERQIRVHFVETKAKKGVYTAELGEIANMKKPGQRENYLNSKMAHRTSLSQ
ncbi:hypothetical protein H0O00_05135, partial [Candidatus Micrarchaeota archaeon]|nr:hypothetical protein [Candidatus Micrarchaeota archaeon]